MDYQLNNSEDSTAANKQYTCEALMTT